MINKYSKMWNFNKRELDIFWGSILGTIGLIILILFLIFILSGHSCDTKTEINNIPFNGVVIRKYIDRNNHGTKTIELYKEGRNNERYSLSFYNPDFEDRIKIGDTLFSKKGSPYVTIKRKDTIMKFLKYIDF